MRGTLHFSIAISLAIVIPLNRCQKNLHFYVLFIERFAFSINFRDILRVNIRLNWKNHIQITFTCFHKCSQNSKLIKSRLYLRIISYDTVFKSMHKIWLSNCDTIWKFYEKISHEIKVWQLKYFKIFNKMNSKTLMVGIKHLLNLFLLILQHL